MPAPAHRAAKQQRCSRQQGFPETKQFSWEPTKKVWSQVIPSQSCSSSMQGLRRGSTRGNRASVDKSLNFLRTWKARYEWSSLPGCGCGRWHCVDLRPLDPDLANPSGETQHVWNQACELAYCWGVWVPPPGLRVPHQPCDVIKARRTAQRQGAKGVAWSQDVP